MLYSVTVDVPRSWIRGPSQCTWSILSLVDTLMPVISISAVISLRRMVLSRIKNTSVRDGIFVRSVAVRGYSLFPRSLNYRLVVLLLRITVATNLRSYGYNRRYQKRCWLRSQICLRGTSPPVFCLLLTRLNLQLYTGDYSWGLLMLGLILSGLIIVSLRIDWFNGFTVRAFVDVASVPMIQFNSSSLIVIY